MLLGDCCLFLDDESNGQWLLNDRWWSLTHRLLYSPVKKKVQYSSYLFDWSFLGFKLSDFQTFRLLDFQTFRLSFMTSLFSVENGMLSSIFFLLFFIFFTSSTCLLPVVHVFDKIFTDTWRYCKNTPTNYPPLFFEITVRSQLWYSYVGLIVTTRTRDKS